MIWSVSTFSRGMTTVRLSMIADRFHVLALHQRGAGSATAPETAAAAAVAGLASSVRPPGPCRPSKFRFDVETQYWPGCEHVAVHGEAHRAARLAPLGAGLAEDPVEPLRLGRLLHRVRAGDDERRGSSPCGRASPSPPRAGPRAGRSCSCPTNTTSTFWPRIGLPGRERHVAERALERRPRRGVLRRRPDPARSPVTGIPCAGFVPKVIIGSSRETSIVTSRS